jgi:hypothetical protein
MTMPSNNPSNPAGYPGASPGSTPSARKPGFMMKVVGLVVVVAVVAAGIGVYASRHHTASTPTAPTSIWNATSNNWSGYAETTAQTGVNYTSASLSWIVSAVSPLSSSEPGCLAQWVGIGGATTRDLIQLGSQSCSSGSTISYDLWWETLPADETPIPSLSVQPGDRITASVAIVSGPTGGSTSSATANYQAIIRLIEREDPSFGTSHIIQHLRQLLSQSTSQLAKEPWFPAVSLELHKLFNTQAPAPAPSPSKVQTWKFSFRVTATNGSVQTWSKTVTYQSSLSSVEWISEAPTDTLGVEPLPNYGTAHYITSSANGSVPTWTAENQIILEDPHGEGSVPSSSAAADAFNTCYFPNFDLGACTAP